jgi:hypothetical protein
MLLVEDIPLLHTRSSEKARPKCSHREDQSELLKRGGWPYRGGDGVQVLTVTRKDAALHRRCEILEYQVFVESGYVEANPEGRIAVFDRYPHQAFLAALTDDRRLPPEERRLSGVVRIVYAPHARAMGPGLFPTIDHAEELRIAPEKLAKILSMNPRQFIDISTMTISKEKRDARASRALITRIMTHAWEMPPLRYALAGIDTVFYEKLKARDLPFEDLGPSVPYWGSPTTATFIDSYRIPRGLLKLVIAYYVVRGLGRRFT